MFEESYGPGSYFSGEKEAAAPAEPAEEYVPYEAPAAEASEVAEPVEELPTYTDDRPRYENYRKEKNKARYWDEEPRSYENNIDDSVFLPDEGETPVFSRKNRRRLTIAIIAVLAALLLVLGGILISHFTGRSNETEATTAKVKTTAFERSVSNNASATETTTEEDISVQYDENGEISESTPDLDPYDDPHHDGFDHAFDDPQHNGFDHAVHGSGHPDSIDRCPVHRPGHAASDTGTESLGPREQLIVHKTKRNRTAP